MPVMGGLELVSALRESGFTAPCCFMTGDEGCLSEAEVILRAEPFLRKPFTVKQAYERV